MELDRLLRPDAPWLQVLRTGDSEAYDAAWALQRAGGGRVAVRVLRGRKMRTATALFDEVGAALQFPPYFGENLNALDECLADLEWLPADAYVLVVLNAAQVLDQDRPEAKRAFWEVLEGAAREWGQPAHGQGARPPRPFRVLLQCTQEEENRVRAHWPAAGAPPPAGR
jgi:RNAse (barnase) inhibitor barstar